MIYLNAKELVNLHAEDKEIQRVLLGDKIVWENIQVIDLGVGQTFDLSSYPNYQSFTVDDFFFTETTQARLTGSQATGNVYTYSGFSKSYNSSTGILTIRNYAQSGSSYAYGNVHAYLVLKWDRMIYLGEGKTFNVTAYDGWENFTADNFLIQSTYGGNIGGIRDPGGWSATSEIVKNYNQANGVFTCYFEGVYLSSKSHSETWSHARQDNTKVYLLKKGI